MTKRDDVLSFDLVLLKPSPGPDGAFYVSRNAPGAEPFWLPKSEAKLIAYVGLTSSSAVIHTFTMPRWLADDRGLTAGRAKGVDDLFSTDGRA